MQINSHEHSIENKYTIEEFRAIIDSYESEGATHLKLSYRDYGNPIINLYEEQKEQPKDVPVLYYTIKNTIGWSRWCDVTGGNHYALNEGYYPSDREVLYCTKDQAKDLGI
tara:strand:+ start:743 stop:1075 length:333 start_codon:yes stop_codon:yes gene_type:complete